MRVALAGHRETDRDAVYLNIGERQAGHMLHRDVHFTSPFISIAMQVEDKNKVSIGCSQGAFP